MPDKIPPGHIAGPSLGHLAPVGTPMDEFLRAELLRRAEWAARPETLEAEALRQRVAEDRQLRKRAGRNKGDAVYGPPDPRKGRPPMTR